ncbi:cytochrome c oxidase accessory protein CcoG [Thalassotalea nanhaiensis]|uniref:Cytochrome c oxidase accessory protein CcoG n=1 Tax=Thalassotalea nanhaiensis TaxID=3065648 RepID=A0ABY9TMH2_9GAMM|nr:cytochrome c oxidase accessory protein CcoG [Colwelliaceae bacterium SQ345]
MGVDKTIDKNQLIFQTKHIDEKIYVKEQKGFFQKIRRYLGVLLMLMFIGIPFIQYQGEQAVLFDVAAQHLKVFSYYFYPQDLLIFTLIFIIAAFSLFFVSSKYGRIWCGFTCPQTIWTFLFLWIEHRIEGNRQQRIKLDKQPLNFNKALKKVTKHFTWLLISLFTGLVFMSYFVPATEIYPRFFTLTSSSLIIAWVLFFALCTYVNASWVREKMCQHMCPYARFQSVMFNANTKVVTYDKARGEQRGPRKLNQPKSESLGDCVDCNLCVVVCPVGIDIREGLQYDCINCGLCIDACDETMAKFSYAKGLIGYTGETTSRTNKKADFGYLTIILLSVVFLLVWLANRSQFEVTVLKDRHALYRINNAGDVENSYQIKILNKTNTATEFELGNYGLDNFIIETSQQVMAHAQTTTTFTVTLIAPEQYQQKFKLFEFVLIDKTGKHKPLKIGTTFHYF